MKPITQTTLTTTLLLTFIGLVLVICCFAAGCNIPPPPAKIPSQYTARETDHGVWIFEYKPGNTKKGVDDANNLMLFMDCLAQWTKDHPELDLRRLEPLHTRVEITVDARTVQASVVNVLAYTKPKEKP